MYVCCSVVHTVLESHARSEANCASLYAQVGRRCVYVHVCIIRGVACLLCSVLLNPVTTWCGHTFFWNCICRSFDHSPNCPVCRTTLSEVSCSLSLHTASVMCDLHGFLMPPLCVHPMQGAGCQVQRELCLKKPDWFCLP